jgi:hypothetical protein
MSDLNVRPNPDIDKPLHDARDQMTFLAAGLRSAVLHECPEPEMLAGAALAAENAARQVQKVIDLIWRPQGR